MASLTFCRRPFSPRFSFVLELFSFCAVCSKPAIKPISRVHSSLEIRSQVLLCLLVWGILARHGLGARNLFISGDADCFMKEDDIEAELMLVCNCWSVQFVCLRPDHTLEFIRFECIFVFCVHFRKTAALHSHLSSLSRNAYSDLIPYPFHALSFDHT